MDICYYVRVFWCYIQNIVNHCTAVPLLIKIKEEEVILNVPNVLENKSTVCIVEGQARASKSQKPTPHPFNNQHLI